MKLIADLHIHSFYSRATSKDLTFEHLYKWARLKGVNVLATGDIAHPGWLNEIKEKLEPAEDGLFKLKNEFEKKISKDIPKACDGIVRFLIGGEISNIYKKGDRVRKIHNVVFTPSIKATGKLQSQLEKIGNIRSDGRPILGLDARDLLEIVLNVDPNAYLIPAHIWTPWFSLFGSKSGFDFIEECFEDLTENIFALETGLSSDPPMNWRLSKLDKYTLVSNSDAHSPQKLAREANVFNTELSYDSLFDALKTGDTEKFWGTIEFFPEEGKYHYDGHRNCGIRWDPKTTLANMCICSVCGKPVTVGVAHRVEMLADRESGKKPLNTNQFKSLIPLPEILAEVYQVGDSSKKVVENYQLLLSRLGPELSILQDIPLEEIQRAGSELLAEGIGRMRRGEVKLEGGYDGEFGVIKLFEDNERDKFNTQIGFFELEINKNEDEEEINTNSDKSFKPAEGVNETNFVYNENNEQVLVEEKNEPQIEINPILLGLNKQQKEAVLCVDKPLIITAGPGTGKTRTLTNRIAYLISEKQVPAESILAITFTNKASEEMRSRLRNLLDTKLVNTITVKTFHAFGAMILRQEAESTGISPLFSICTEDDRKNILKQLYPKLSDKEINSALGKISSAKGELKTPELFRQDEMFQIEKEFIPIYKSYEKYLRKNNLLDFDDLILLAIKLFEDQPGILYKFQNRFKWISVDEYQDINLAQYRLLKLLTCPGNNICVIGDPDQAIYGFRGADRKYFMEFHQDFPDAKKIYLFKNYRSTQIILNASGQVISKSGERESRELLTDVVGKTKLEIYQAPTYKAEAEYVVHQIEKMVGGTSYFSLDSGRVDNNEQKERSFSDFAVLYRLGAQSHALIEAFDRSGIPYQTVGESSLFEKKEIKEALSYLWFIYNPGSAYHRQIIKKDYSKIISLLENLSASIEKYPVAELLEQIREFISANTLHGIDRKQNELLHKLVLKAIPFDNRLKDFLEMTVLQKETDEYDQRADRVTLMTLHASKGLEFPVVFIVGCEENLVPYKKDDEPFDINEERRLFYVGLTRAKEKLILTNAKTRFLFGRTLENSPSQFFNDIEDVLKDFKKFEYNKRKNENEKKGNEQLGLF